MNDAANIIPREASADDVADALARIAYMPANVALWLAVRSGWDVSLSRDRHHIRLTTDLPAYYTDFVREHEAEIVDLMRRRFLRNWRTAPGREKHSRRADRSRHTVSRSPMDVSQRSRSAASSKRQRCRSFEEE
jgi:hypothetical protein